MEMKHETHSHTVKVFRTEGGVEYIPCISMEDAKVARKERIAQGGVVCALVGTVEDFVKIDELFTR
jgi:hypothetical protein